MKSLLQLRDLRQSSEGSGGQAAVHPVGSTIIVMLDAAVSQFEASRSAGQVDVVDVLALYNVDVV